MSEKILSYMTPYEKAPSALSDEEILVRSRIEPWLFTFIVERYEAAFLRKLKAVLRDPRDIEEVVQDTFVKIYLNADKFEPQTGASFSSWAYKILLNTAFTRYQKAVKEGQRFTILDPEFEHLVGERQSHRGFEEEADAIERILVKLPGHFAHVLRLHYLERWSQEDIARAEMTRVGNIKARIHRAKIAFRKLAKGDNKLDIL
jgi:RNA polymerase sigma-70 factor, ECF subfamily